MRYIIACCWPPEMGQGVSTVSREIAKQLARKGHKVFYLSPESSFDNWYAENKLEKISVGKNLDPKRGLIEVVKATRKIKPDALINNDHPYVQAALPAIDTRKIVLSHTMSWGTASLARLNQEWADSLVVISYDMLRDLLEKGVPAEKLSLIMNGIEDPFDHQWLPTTEKKGRLRIVFAGSWTRIKGADLVLETILNAPADTDWVRLDIFGAIKTKQANLIKNSPWVRAHGRVPRAQFLRAVNDADILILPSKKEGCPMSVIEAMSRGTLPIVSDGKGAMRWMVSHGEDGFLARRKKWSSDLWSLLDYLHNNRLVMHRIKLASRLKYNREFDIVHMVEKLERLVDNKPRSKEPSEGPYESIVWHRPGVNQPISRRVIEGLRYKMGWLQSGGLVTLQEIEDGCLP